MAAIAADHGARTVVGLQARQAPAIAFVRDLLSDGYVGEVLSTTMIGVSVPGDVVIQPNAYMLDRTNGANLLTVAVGHSMPSQQTSTTGLTPCRTSPTPSDATRSSPPSSGPRHQGNG